MKSAQRTLYSQSNYSNDIFINMNSIVLRLILYYSMLPFYILKGFYLQIKLSEITGNKIEIEIILQNVHRNDIHNLFMNRNT